MHSQLPVTDPAGNQVLVLCCSPAIFSLPLHGQSQIILKLNINRVNTKYELTRDFDSFWVSWKNHRNRCTLADYTLGSYASTMRLYNTLRYG